MFRSLFALALSLWSLEAAAVPRLRLLDADGDGYPRAIDCNDDDPAVHPGAVDVCDAAAVDDDCNPRTGLATLELAGVVTDVSSELRGASSVEVVSYTVPTGATLSLCAPNFYVNLDLEGDATLIGHGDVVLDGRGVGSVVRSESTGGDISLTGLTLANGYGDGLWGAALGIEEAGDVTLTDVSVRDSVGAEASSVGGGIAVLYSGTVTLTRVTVRDNIARTAGGIALWSNDGVVMRQVEVSDNSTWVNGNFGGLYSYRNGVVDIDGLALERNWANMRGGWHTEGETAVVRNARVAYNHARYQDGGISVLGATLDIADSTLEGNLVDLNEGAALRLSSGSVVAANVVFAANETVDSEVVYLFGGSMTCTGCTVQDNVTPTAAAFGLRGDATLDIVDSDFVGNVNDVHAIGSGTMYSFGVDASFTCDASSCG